MPASPHVSWHTDTLRRTGVRREGKDVSEQKRALGSYYSPEPYARALVRWALNGTPGRVLDPSYGGCAVLRVALDELGGLGAAEPAQLIYGADIDDGAAQWAAHLAAQGVPGGHLRAADFLSLAPGKELPLVAAVAGNPPYVRHHRLAAAAREKAVAAAESAGVTLSGRASLWAYFVVHAARFVEPGGRLAFLLPGAVLQADYAPPVLEFLQRMFGDVHLVRVRERIFEDAQEETVVLLAADARAAMAAANCRFSEVDDLAGLEHLLARPVTTRRAYTVQLSGVAEWKQATVSTRALEVFARFLKQPKVTALEQVATVGLGTVTGANAVFLLTDADAVELEVLRHTVPVVARSAWLAGPVLTSVGLAVARGNRPGRLLTLPEDFRLDRRTRLGRYLAAAEDDGVHERRHCRRTPWWSLRDVRVPDAFLPYTVAAPRGVTLNQAEAGSTNTVHQVRWVGRPAEAERRSYVLSTWSSLGLLAAELYGRHYGGGVLKLELSAAQRLPVAAGLTISDQHWAAVQSDRHVAQDLADRALLAAGLGIMEADLAVCRDAAATLAQERVGFRSDPDEVRSA